MAEPSGNELASAAAKGDLVQLTNLLQKNVNVNAQNGFGRTALQTVLFLYALFGRNDLSGWEACCSEPRTFDVMKLGDPKIARRLLLSGADPNLKDSTGFAVIHDVAREGFADTLQALLEFQADVNLEDAEGNLPLHLAAQEGHAPVVEALLARADCKVGHRNKRGATAYDLAKLYKRSAVVKLLEDSRCCPAPMD
ncbi:cyclin-dependent kinase 4 inhibitor C isoform X1 [Accipiter gentilis]|uniref:cyclin-dependent kinase 4 inhibitor C isoform X1 n=1 Tax=Astur gentilis TaxID=8957 RepID=UPI00210F5C7F|nr:cyclin-dependent kinase 4 inhibitor C isoform X1 [Accipiter gentilis]